ncbi:MAG: peptidyl-prolyl cis-trans isomerase [Novosphingobium sp.]|nr:peptidyl-prolyl cis-trans isomerase [Novosphingobium sp.]
MAWKDRLARIDPLILFLAAGLALYLLLDAAGLVRGDERRIVVDDASLTAFMASRSGGEPGGSPSQLGAAARDKLVREYIREEALYREALALGLDRDDSAIRRRLVQSLKYSLEAGLSGQGSIPAPTDAELRAFFAAHRDRYAESARISFSHVFFDKRRRGGSAAREAALATLPKLRSGDWLAAGDRYPYQRSQSDMTGDALASEWGEAAAKRVFAMPVDEGKWQGPVESDLGFHLVRIDAMSAGGEPDFAEIRPALVAGWAQQQREKALEKAIDRIVGEYRVRIEPGLGKSPQ